MIKKIFAVVALILILGVIVYKLDYEPAGPHLDGLIPEEAVPGTLLTLVGPDLRGASDVKILFNDKAVVPDSIAPKGLSVRVPADVQSGRVRVQADGRLSNALAFRVKAGMPAGHPAVPGMAEMGAAPKMGGKAPQQVAGPDSEPEAQGEPENAHEFYAADTAKPAIDFALQDAAGKTVRLADFKGKVIALNFWASWCPPCLEEVPSLERLTKRAATMNLVVLAVSVDKSFADVRKALPGTKLNVLLDPTSELAHRYGTMKFPETWIIDTHGKIVARFIGARDWDSPLFENLFGMLIRGEALPMMGR